MYDSTNSSPDHGITPLRRRLDPLRIAALSAAVAVHVAIALALLLPVPHLEQGFAPVEPALVVDIVRAPAVAPDLPAPPRQEQPPRRVTSPPGEVVTTTAPDGVESIPTWRFDPGKGIALVVYSDRPNLDLLTPDQPPSEILHYRASFDPTVIEGLNGGDAGGAMTFDVLVDETGTPSAIVPKLQSGSQRAFETAMAVVGQWRFAPALKDGLPVQAWLEVSIEF